MESEIYGENRKKQERTKTRKRIIVQELRERGYRITKQRLLLLDIILEEECCSCKEIYYRISKVDSRVGTATVYRLVNLLEEIGAISRKNMYKIAYGMDCGKENAYKIELDDGTDRRLSGENWNRVVYEGLKACGYIENQKIRNVVV